MVKPNKNYNEKNKKLFLKKNKIHLKNLSFSCFIAYNTSCPEKFFKSKKDFQKVIFSKFFDENTEEKIEFLEKYTSNQYFVQYDESFNKNLGFKLIEKPKDYFSNNEKIDGNLVCSCYNAYLSAYPNSCLNLLQFYKLYKLKINSISDFDNKKYFLLFENKDFHVFSKEDVLNGKIGSYHPEDVHYELKENNPILDRTYDNETYERSYLLNYEDFSEASWVSSDLVPYELKKKYNDENPSTKLQLKKNPFKFKEERGHIKERIDAIKIKNLGKFLYYK